MMRTHTQIESPQVWNSSVLIGLMAVICLVPFNFLPNAVLKVAGLRLPLDVLIFGPLGTALLIYSTLDLWRNRTMPAFLFWSLGFTAILVLSALLAHPDKGSVGTALGFLLRGVAPASFGFVLGRRATARGLFVRWLPVLAVVVSIAALYEPLTGRYFLFKRTLAPGQPPAELWSPARGVPSGAIGQPLPLATLLNLFFPFCLYGWFVRRSQFSAVAAALVAATILFTVRRSGYLVLAATAIGMAGVLGRRPLAFVSILIAIAGACAITSPSTRALMKERLRPGYTEHELGGSHRTMVYGTALAVVRAHPILGIGTRRYESDFKKYAPYPEAINTPDSQYLRVAMENGFLGLISFIGFLASLSGLIRSWRGEGLPFLAAAAGFAVMMFFVDALYWPATQLSFMAIMGVGMGRLESIPATVISSE